MGSVADVAPEVDVTLLVWADPFQARGGLPMGCRGHLSGRFTGAGWFRR